MNVQTVSWKKSTSASVSFQRKKATEKAKQNSNKEILSRALNEFEPQPTVFTPKQQELFFEIEEFKDKHIVDDMFNSLNEAIEIENQFQNRRYELIKKDGITYNRTKEYLPHAGGYRVNIDAKDEDGKLLYNFEKKVYGDYAINTIKQDVPNYGKVKLACQGENGQASLIVNNTKNGQYLFGAIVDEEGNFRVDYINNFRK